MRADRTGGWDVHTHLIPESIVEIARRARFGLEVVDETLITVAARVPLKRIVRPDLLDAWVEDNGLEGAIVSPPPPLYRPDLEDRLGWASAVNEGLDAMCADHPMLRPMAYLPMEDPGLALAALGHLGDGWAGVTLGTDLGENLYSDRRYDPVWEELSDRGMPAFIHPGTCDDHRLSGFYLSNLVGNPYETTVAAAHLVFGGVLSRYPHLSLMLAHGGGAVAQLVGRWQRGFETGRPGLAGLDLSPREAVRRFFVDTLVHDDAALRLVADVFGTDRIMFGSDWPFPMGSDGRGSTSEWEGFEDAAAANSLALFGPARG